MEFIDAFKINNSKLFDITAKSLEIRTVNEAKLLSNVLTDIENQVRDLIREG